MFVDKAKIFVKAGKGGDGLISFRREKYVPQGGPAGGDGGKGADIIFRVDEGLRTLMDFRYQKHFKAAAGEKGKIKNMHGANADNMIVRVPPGTMVIDDDTHELIADLTKHGQEVVVAKGGRGGRGNVRFASANNPAPYIAENGEEGEERWIVLELKVMADVGLVGFPSVGKSTLISVVSAAKPKIADYHFTTLSPNLGVVDVGDGRSFTMADLPGLIEGAHQGSGLGHEFLKHIERTRIIVHVVDMSGLEQDPFDAWLKINNELSLYNEKLIKLPQMIAASKMDLPDAEQHLIDFRKKLAEFDADSDYEVFPISAATKAGITPLLYRLADMLDAIPAEPQIEEVPDVEERKIYRLDTKQEAPFTIRRENDVFVVESERIEKLIQRTQFGSYDAVDRFTRILRKMGVDNALREKGAQDGHTVKIGELEFEFVEKDF